VGIKHNYKINSFELKLKQFGAIRRIGAFEEYELFDYWYFCEFDTPKGEKSGYKLIFDGIDIG
jgi:hypothetical protein